MVEFVRFIDRQGSVSINVGMIQHIRYISSTVTEIKLYNGDVYEVHKGFNDVLEGIKKINMTFKDVFDMIDTAAGAADKQD